MNTAFNPYRTTRAARRYVSPRTHPLNQFERETRGLSYMLKEADCPEAALQVAAAEMAALVWGPCHLIPAPDHTGDTAANRRLAKAIAAHVKGGAEVHDILTRTAPAPSACDRHRTKGAPVSVAEHHIARRDAKPIPCRRTFIVDNVLVGGNTIRASLRRRRGSRFNKDLPFFLPRPWEGAWQPARPTAQPGRGSRKCGVNDRTGGECRQGGGAGIA